MRSHLVEDSCRMWRASWSHGRAGPRTEAGGEERGQLFRRFTRRSRASSRQIKEMASGAEAAFQDSRSTIRPGTRPSSRRACSWAGKYSRNPSTHGRLRRTKLLGLGDTSGEAPATEIRPEYHASQMYPEMPAATAPMVNNVDDDDIVENQVYSFPATCPGCTKSCTTNMKMVNIPAFQASSLDEHCVRSLRMYG